MDNVKLVKRAKVGDKEAFAALYQTIYEEMYRYALCVLSDKYDAEDVVSETVVDAYKSIRLLKDDKLFKNWIFKILSNKCKRKLATYYENTVTLDEGVNVDCSERSQTESVLDLRNAFKELNSEEKMIISYKVAMGYSSVEIGKMLSLSDNTIRSKYKRAIDKLKCRMEA